MNRRRMSVLGIAAALLALAGPAAAHVTVNPGQAEAGGYAKLAFRVPNERDDSATTKVEVFFPEGQPFASVSVRPTPGWSVTVEKSTLGKPIEREGRDPITEAVAKVTWHGGEVAPGEFQEFEVSAGPMPEGGIDKLVFKAVQTYANGEVVRWIDEPGADGAEPEHPAPVLSIVDGERSNGADADDGADGAAAAPGADSDSDESGSDDSASADSASDDSGGDDSDGAVDPLSAVALVAALLALVVALAARRSPKATATP